VILESSPVRALDAAPPGVVVETTGGRVRAECAVVALNAFAGPLVPYLADRIRPLRGQCLGFAADGALAAPSPAYADHGRVYWRQTADRLLIGGFDDLALDEEATAELGTTALIQDAIEAFARRHLGVEGRPVATRWSGIMGISLDGFPFVGPIPGMPLFCAAGFTGLGFGYAMLAARWVSEAITAGRDRTPERYRASRPFQPQAWPPWAGSSSPQGEKQ
jgi:glycine/D-amino acid oxidase-like deaminating enzyme